MIFFSIFAPSIRFRSLVARPCGGTYNRFQKGPSDDNIIVKSTMDFSGENLQISALASCARKHRFVTTACCTTRLRHKALSKTTSGPSQRLLVLKINRPYTRACSLSTKPCVLWRAGVLTLLRCTAACPEVCYSSENRHIVFIMCVWLEFGCFLCS